MIFADIGEAYNRTVDYIEYLAMYINAEAVDRVRRSRETAGVAGEESKKAFEELLEKTFGRGLGEETTNNE